MVRLETGDGKAIRAPLGLLERSRVIQRVCRLIHSAAGDGQGKEDFLPLHGIRSSEVLLKVLLWTEFHKGHEEPAWVAKMTPVSAEEMELQVDDWDKEFLREKIGLVCALMEAADYLDIRWLYKLCAHKIAFHSRQAKDAGLEEYQQKIHSLTMFEWPAEEREQPPEKFPEKRKIEIEHRLRLFLVN